MISLDQLKLLEQKVEQALHKILDLQKENTMLVTENGDLKAEVELLREQCDRLEQDEAKIEQGILNVLDKLNTVENTVRESQVDTLPENPLPSSSATNYVTESNTADMEEENTIEASTPQENEENESIQSAHINEDTSENKTTAGGMLSHAEQSSQLDIF